MRRPGRLYRSLKPSAPLFEFSVDDGTVLTDDQLRSITIKRGKTGAGGGVHPSTAEVAIAGFGSVRTGLNCSLKLTGAGAALVADLGRGTAANIAPRFTGRIGRQLVDDTGSSSDTTFLAASWTAQLPGDGTAPAITKGLAVATAITRLMTPPTLPLSAPVRMADHAAHGTVYLPPEPGSTYADLIGKYTTDLGILVRETRLGGRQILTHQFRRDRAQFTMAGAPTLTRSQALSPARWEQGNETMPRNHRLLYVNSADELVARTYGDPDSTTTERVDVDMSHIKFADDTQASMEAYARRAADWTSSYSIPSITIDLLLLLTSPHAMHRAQAGRLLSMEVGDPMFLSEDWHPQLQGIHYAEALNETITPDSWTLELGLVPAHAAIGEISPAVPARTWEAANHPWSADPRTWATT